MCVCVLYLVGSADEVQVVAVEELADHIGAKGEGDAAVVFSPALDVFIGVRPQQVTQEAWEEKYTILRQLTFIFIVDSSVIYFLY